MRTKNAKAITAAEHKHMEAVKSVACAICDAPPPSDAHHIRQGDHFTVIALCKDCHQNPVLGWHGQKRAWLIRKMDEIKALNITLERVLRSMLHK